MRNLSLAALLVAASLSASGWGWLCRPGFDGLYAAASIGMLTDDVSYTTELFNTGGLNLVQSQRVEACRKRLWGDLCIGYGWTFCNCLYAGARLGANFSHSLVPSQSFCWAFTSVAPITQDVFFQLNNVEPYLDLKSGLVFCNNVMFFGFVGFTYNEATLTGVESTVEFDVFDLTLGETFRRRGVAGIRTGGGIEFLFCGRFGVNLNYIYTFYSEQHLQRRVIKGGNQTIEVDIKARPARQVIALGFSSYF